jgi:hypothetical protein
MDNVARKVGSFFISFLSLLSCSTIDQESPGLFAIDQLLDEQSGYLTRNGSRLTKVSSLGEYCDTIYVTPRNTEEWKKELEIFAVIDAINKPANKAFYTIQRHPDNKSNLSVKAFTTKEDLPVQFLRLFYQTTEEKVRRIEANYCETNVLYNSTRLLTMEFQQINDTMVLTSYEILGDQKMFLGDSVKYTIKGTVTLSN